MSQVEVDVDIICPVCCVDLEPDHTSDAGTLTCECGCVFNYYVQTNVDIHIEYYPEDEDDDPCADED